MNLLIHWVGQNMNTLALFSWVMFLPIAFFSIDGPRNPHRYKHKYSQSYINLMLSTQYRLRLASICKDIGAGVEVSLEDMIWAEKLAKANTAARGMLNTARRISTDPTDSFLNSLDIGDPDSSNHRRGFGDPQDEVDWFHNERSDDWRQRD